MNVARVVLRRQALCSPTLLRSANINTLQKCTRPVPTFSASRHLHATSRRHGTTTLPNILAGGPAPPVVVKSLEETGIQLDDGLTLPGACIFLEGEVFLWDVPEADKWSKMSAREIQERFEIFEVVVPKPEILLLGTGKSVALPPPALREYLNKIGIQLDVLDTWNACSTYNLLAEEGRRVAAALLPYTPHVWQRS